MRPLVLVLSALLLASPLFLASPALATEGRWEQIDDAEGVTVFRKEVEGSPVVAFRGETELDAAPEQVLWVLATNERRTEWVDLCAESRVLERLGPYDQVIYQRFALPWYLSDRDYVYRATAVRTPEGGVELRLSSCEHPQAPETCGVRARLIESRYLLTPLPGGKTRIAVEIHTDPMGMVPKWLVNVVQAEWPLKTLSGIKQQLTRSDVGTCALPPPAPAQGTPAHAQGTPAPAAQGTVAAGVTAAEGAQPAQPASTPRQR